MKFSIILADPPWRFKNWSIGELAKRGEKWARRNGRSPYDVETTVELATIPVGDLAAKDCVLFLWATHPKLNEAFDLLKAWGFEYKTVAFTWVKLTPKAFDAYHRLLAEGMSFEEIIVRLFHFGLGYWTRQNPELILLATRGKPKRVNNSVANLIVSPRGSHSSKPKEIHQRIVDLMGDLPRIELFARELTEGWSCVGNEITGNDIREDIRILAERDEEAVRTRGSATPAPVAGPPPAAPPPQYPAQAPAQVPQAPQYPQHPAATNGPAPAAQPFIEGPPPSYAPPVQQAPPAAAPVYTPPIPQELPAASAAPGSAYAPPVAPATVYAPPAPAYGSSPLHQFSMENDGGFILLPNDTRVEAELMEAKMAPAKNGSGNMVLNLRWRTTWPREYAHLRIYDNITMTPDWAAKYQSLFRNCEGAQGQPLLSPDGLRYVGSAVQTGAQEWEFPDLIGNVVAFRTRQDETNTGREVNKIHGNYEKATETEGMAVESAGNGAAVASGPPAQVNWSP